jgi:hypothetical protein
MIGNIDELEMAPEPASKNYIEVDETVDFKPKSGQLKRYVRATKESGFVPNLTGVIVGSAYQVDVSIVADKDNSESIVSDPFSVERAVEGDATPIKIFRKSWSRSSNQTEMKPEGSFTFKQLKDEDGSLAKRLGVTGMRIFRISYLVSGGKRIALRLPPSTGPTYAKAVRTLLGTKAPQHVVTVGVTAAPVQQGKRSFFMPTVTVQGAVEKAQWGEISAALNYFLGHLRQVPAAAPAAAAPLTAAALCAAKTEPLPFEAPLGATAEEAKKIF